MNGRRLVARAPAFVVSSPLGVRGGGQNNAMHTSLRIPPSNRNHHLWNNHGTWWCHFTVHRPDFTKQRVRRSTGTRVVEEARQVRDFLLSTKPEGI
jgi:hypothetical protein